MAADEETSDVLMRALQHLLRPIVRLLVARGILYPALSSLLKIVYVEVALREFPIEGKRQTDSRLSLLTGVHRKDVRRLRSETGAGHRAPASVSLGAQVVARWTGDPRYHDTEGRPRPLLRTAASAGHDPSFDELVTSVSKDIRPRSVLDEWLRLGVAVLDSDDRVSLNAEAFVPSHGFNEKLYYYGRNLHDHAAAGTHNLLEGEPPLLDRSVYYSALTSESVIELSKLATRAGMEAVQAVNRRALELKQRDRGKPYARLRMNFGIYFFHADPAEEETPGGDEGDGL